MPKRTREERLVARVAELEEALERSRGVTEALRTVGMAVGTTQELDPLLQLILTTTIDVLQADRGTLYLLREGRLVSRVKQGGKLRTIQVGLGQGIAGHVAKTGRVVRVADAYQDERFDRSWDDQSGYRTRSILAVPIKGHHGKTEGVIQVLNKRGRKGSAPEEFTVHDKQLLQVLATQTAVALDKSELFRTLMRQNEQLADTKNRLERSLRDLEFLYELESAMSRAETPSELARNVIRLTARACQAQAGALLIASSDTQLSLYVVNLDREDVREVIVQPGEGIAGRAAQQRALIRIDDVKRARDPRRVREMLEINVRSAIAAPLLGDSDLGLGALALYNHEGRPSRFTDEDGRLLELVSANVSTAIRLLDARFEREREIRFTSLGRLLSGVMHDLRTPLTVISGYVQLMQVADGPALRAEYGQIVRQQFENISSMQSDLLAFARGETTVLIRKVYISKFFDDLAVEFSPEFKQSGVKLDVDITDAGTAFFDESKMKRAFQNLVRNAMEAMPGGGTLRLAARSEGDELVMTVSDSGNGIPKTIRNKLFEPFVTAGKTLGTGLGLANVKEIVEEHGGSIEVKSSRRGTCFTIRILQAASPTSHRAPNMVL